MAAQQPQKPHHGGGSRRLGLAGRGLTEPQIPQQNAAGAAAGPARQQAKEMIERERDPSLSLSLGETCFPREHRCRNHQHPRP